MTSPEFLVGTIEGFFGEPWPQTVRLQHLDFLARWRFNTYLYAPKADPWLRRRWTEAWPAPEQAKLHELARTARDLGLNFGMGLSPFEAYLDYGSERRRLLLDKVDSLLAFQPDILALLFDDMRGDTPELAATQVAMVKDIQAHAPQLRMLFCPTYYSDDPVLERVFGARPADYWEALGQQLPESVEVFWTGPQVCSATVEDADLSAITNLLQRPVVLWDNYPVNDGEKLSRHLHLRPAGARPSLESSVMAGRLCNPMNQGSLSQLAYYDMASRLGSDAGDFAGWAETCLGQELAKRLLADVSALQDAGLDQLTDGQRADYIQCYQAFTHPAAQEVVGWLRGEYTFDPACLTD